MKAHLASVLPPDDMKLGQPPVNEFMPKAAEIVAKKLQGEIKTIPKLVDTGKEHFELLFKQDDTFDQPFVSITLLMNCIDEGYPLTVES